MTFARIVSGVDLVATAKAHGLSSGALCRCFRMPPGLVGAYEIVSTLCANPFVSEGVVLETVEIGPDRPDFFGVNQGGESGEPRWREVRVIRSGCVGGAQVRQVVR